MRDIESREDILLILNHFYEAALSDKEIGHFFTEVVPLHLPIHIPVIADFWEMVVLGKGHYQKDVMAVHRGIHQLSTIRKEHLDRWVTLFTQTVDAHFSGDRASLMTQRARSIATLMDIKLNHPPINTIK